MLNASIQVIDNSLQQTHLLDLVRGKVLNIDSTVAMFLEIPEDNLFMSRLKQFGVLSYVWKFWNYAMIYWTQLSI